MNKLQKLKDKISKQNHYTTRLSIKEKRKLIHIKHHYNLIKYLMNKYVYKDKYKLSDYLKELRVIKLSLEFLYNEQKGDDLRSGIETYGYKDIESIKSDLYYIGDRFYAQFRLKWLIDLIDIYDVKNDKIDENMIGLHKALKWATTMTVEEYEKLREG